MKKKLETFLKVKVLPIFLQLIVRFIYFTNKKVFNHPKLDENKNYVIAFWHGDLIMQSFNYYELKKNGRVKAMVSEHRDGELISRAFEKLGIGTVRGSSTRGGAKALISALKELKAGTDIAITPDGPKGPRFSVADGIVAISQKSKCEIIIFNCKASSYWQFNSWDKFVLPKPFGTLELFVQEPLNIEGLSMDEAKALIKEKMMEKVIN